jgi:hypothetical protein
MPNWELGHRWPKLTNASTSLRAWRCHRLLLAGVLLRYVLEVLSTNENKVIASIAL